MQFDQNSIAASATAAFAVVPEGSEVVDVIIMTAEAAAATGARGTPDAATAAFTVVLEGAEVADVVTMAAEATSVTGACGTPNAATAAFAVFTYGDSSGHRVGSVAARGAYNMTSAAMMAFVVVLEGLDMVL